MTKTCPSCDVLAPPDARYCRHCGVPLQRLNASGARDGSISPIAATVPLSSQNTTDEIVAPPAAPPPPPAAASHTSEVTHAEMNELLRHDASAGEVEEGKANYSERLRDNGSSDAASDDFDSEQTQITISVRPLTSRDLPADAAAAASVVALRVPHNHPQFNATPQQVTLSPTGSHQPETDATTTSPAAPPLSPTPPRLPVRSSEARTLRVWLGLGIAALSIAVIGGLALAAYRVGSRLWPASEDTPAVVNGEAAPVLNDPQALANAKLAEADALLVSGNTAEAQARLREAAALDPANPEPQRRLARLLLANGARRAGIEALKLITQLAPGDTEAWLTLASAQVAEGLYEDALESYRGLGQAAPAALARDAVQLKYADALRLSGQSAEARVIYRRLASSPDAEVASASKLQLGQPTPSPTNEAIDEAKAQALETAREEARAEEANRAREAASAATPTPQPNVTSARPEPAAAATDPTKVSPASPAEHYGRGVSLWATNRGAAVAEFRAAAERGNADASYYLGLSLAEGRNPRSLKRADLIAALVHFGRARRGRFRAQSLTYEEQLGRELDRRRNDER